jgi:thioredoxin-related protein
MKRDLLVLIFSLLVSVGGAQPVSPAPSWREDHATAVAEAVRTNRPVLINFTGSDWCVWCHRLRDEVFQTPAFARYASEALVLVEADFPRKKTLSPELKKQNVALAEKYGVTGYPTIILVDPAGNELARLNYMQGGPKTFIREIKRHIPADKPATGS